MKKGLTTTIIILLSIIFFIVMATLFWTYVQGGLPEEERSGSLPEPGDCLETGCEDNADGLLCIDSKQGWHCGCILTSSNWGDEPQCMIGYECDTTNNKCI